jgi:hypothetical protein
MRPSYQAVSVQLKSEYVARRFRLSRKQARRLLIQRGLCVVMVERAAPKRQ